MGTKRAKRKLLSREAKLRARGLLDMLYKPSELADELQIDQRVIYRKLIPEGTYAYKRTTTGTSGFTDLKVAALVRSLDRKPGSTLAADEAYCLRCRKAVKLVNPKRNTKHALTILQSQCPECGNQDYSLMLRSRLERC